MTPEDHKLLALWAADCAEGVLGVFEAACPGDLRPRNAVAAARAWARGDLAVSAARSAAFAAHAAARSATNTDTHTDTAATFAARAAGHAAATAHVWTHAPHAAAYALRAVSDQAGERARQLGGLPFHLRPLVAPADSAPA